MTALLLTLPGTLLIVSLKEKTLTVYECALRRLFGAFCKQVADFFQQDFLTRRL